MANTCLNEIYITGKPATLHKLYDAIRAVRAEKNKETSDLYRLLQRLGYKNASVSARENFTGEVELIKDFHNKRTLRTEELIRICSESSWNFQGAAWQLVKKKYPSLSIYYLEEENGCNIFSTNDTEREYITCKYSLDYQTQDGDSDVVYFDDDCTLIEYVHDIFDSTVGTFQEAQEAIQSIEDSSDGDSYATLREVCFDDNYNLL